MPPKPKQLTKEELLKQQQEEADGIITEHDRLSYFSKLERES